MSASSKCNHADFGIDFLPMAHDDDPNTVFLKLRASCSVCGAVFRFVGIDSDDDRDMPTANRRGTEVILPLVCEVL
jgi:hypothetical protein